MSRTAIRIIVIALLLANLIFLGIKYQGELVALKKPMIERLRPFLPEGMLPELVVENPLIIQTSASGLFDAINAHRAKQNLPLYQKDETTCHVATLLSLSGTESSNNFLDKCESCSRGAVVNISNQAPAVRLIAEIKNNQSESDLITGQEYTHLCIAETDSTLTMFLASYHVPTSTKIVNPPTNPNYQPQPTIPPKNFSEDELWQALVDYRHAHTRPDLSRDENLCIYARKRVQEHIDMYAAKRKEEYSRPDKYPLDAHAGFERDGDSGELFSITNRRVVAENLAYWPSAQYATHVIEWGWDTSTEGHREAQLSNDYSHACISGKDGFYVAIFGRS